MAPYFDDFDKSKGFLKVLFKLVSQCKQGTYNAANFIARSDRHVWSRCL